MDESDEDKALLEDDSMDEMHELEDDLMASIDTNASPVKASVANVHRRFEDDSDEEGKDEDSDESELFNGSSSSDESGSSPSKDAVSSERISPMTTTATSRRRDEAKENEDDDDDDDPPEIPGSPLRATTGSEMTGQEPVITRGEIGSSRQKQSPPTTDILTIRHGSNSDSENENDDEYETKEMEAPRAMEFHTSSSSSESEREATDSEDDDDEDNNRRRNNKKPVDGSFHARQDRPKTAAKELALYRGVMPSEYFEQIVQDAPSSPKKQEQATATGNARDRRQEQRVAAPRQSSEKARTQSSKYKVRVPREIEELFQYVDAFNPDETDIPTRLQPFIPEYVPTVGLPFDGIQIPRPDNKRDASGIAFVREPCAQSNAAELELLLAARAKNHRRKRQIDSIERVHSIEDSSNRPREIDNWIASVARVQASKPLPQVQYKKPMPSETSLMELWPEEFEIFLSTQPSIPLSKMDLDLPDMIRVVCGILDIPVYDGFQIHSLHALFSLYLEVIAYDKELLGRAEDKGR